MIRFALSLCIILALTFQAHAHYISEQGTGDTRLKACTRAKNKVIDKERYVHDQQG